MADTAPPYHHGNLRSELLDLAERTLEEAGVAGLSLRGLARELGVSHSAPRQHFADKKALLDALVLRGLERLGTELDDGLGRASGGFEQRLTTFARVYVGFATRCPALLALVFAHKDDPARPELQAANDRTFAAPVALIDGARDRGEIVGDDPDRVAMAVLATLQGLASIITGGMIADRSPDAVVTGTVHSLVRGLSPRR
ncbi:TetR/AcrR family transcriptional regulator [Amycolatopsis sp. NBC_01307]|uniref:TetR/AcrR family transcriptional regulator n=1 Tax=Amycolatopsis sp. NBC_01307 TaxID=2903561 RepID=UPI002E0E0DA3|nr:TetR/AcrR family transcriptional regulator [Amycolatopsis sp. NBC_01307]